MDLRVDRAEAPAGADRRADDERHACACSFEMYQNFAAWLTSASIGSAMKSPNMISMTGRRPVTAAPNAAPASASSEIGVSNTRSAPKRSAGRGVTLKTPPARGDVLAEEDDALVALELLGERVADARARNSSVGCGVTAANSVGAAASRGSG